MYMHVESCFLDALGRAHPSNLPSSPSSSPSLNRFLSLILTVIVDRHVQCEVTRADDDTIYIIYENTYSSNAENLDI